MKKRQPTFVWGVEYRTRHRKDEEWIGPCGIFMYLGHYVLPLEPAHPIIDQLWDRPYFFRTRKQAREAMKSARGGNTHFVWRVVKYRLLWEKVGRKEL